MYNIYMYIASIFSSVFIFDYLFSFYDIVAEKKLQKQSFIFSRIPIFPPINADKLRESISPFPAEYGAVLLLLNTSVLRDIPAIVVMVATLRCPSLFDINIKISEHLVS